MVRACRLVRQDCGSLPWILKVTSGKHSVMIVFVVFFYVEINASIALVCISGIENALHGLNLLEDVSRSPRLMEGGATFNCLMAS